MSLVKFGQIIFEIVIDISLNVIYQETTSDASPVELSEPKKRSKSAATTEAIFLHVHFLFD